MTKPILSDPDTRAAIERHAASTFDSLVAAGSAHYDRARHLPRVLPMDPLVLADDSAGGRVRTLARLARALRAERNRGRAGHWTYDLNRHIALAEAYTAERRLLERSRRSEKA